MRAPHGQHSILVNPPRQIWPTILCMALVVGVPIPFLLVRMYTRIQIHRKVWWDDFPYTGMLMQSINYGGCTDLWNVSKADFKKFTHHTHTQLFHNLEIIARIGMFFTKTAILLLFHRIFVPTGSRRTRIWWAIWIVFWWNLLYALALILSVSLQCVGKDALVAAGKECVDEFAVVMCASVINITTDVALLIIPMFAVWGLHLPSRKKWKLSAVFGVGFLGVLSSVARLGYQIVYATRPNKTIIFITLLLINAAEQFIGVFVSCMPILPAFYRHLFSSSPQKPPSTSSSSYKPHSLRTKALSASIINGHPRSRTTHAQAGVGDSYPMHKTTKRGYEEIEAAELGRGVGSPGGGGGGGIVKRTDMTVVSERRSTESSVPVLLGV
ncbi:MAG: hypothetical protein Q9219_003960 [cf. Caloplaca sp. 3 TL-2023]